MKRFKTEKELIEEIGTDWRSYLGVNWNEDMFPILGEPYNGPLKNAKLPRLYKHIVQGNWTITEKMLTDKPLLPIGTQVASPLTKQGNSASGYSDNIYYKGLCYSKTHHALWNSKEGTGGNFFYASEILEAYERYQKEQAPKIEESTFKFKAGDKVFLPNYSERKEISIHQSYFELNTEYTITNTGTYIFNKEIGIEKCIVLNKSKYRGFIPEDLFKPISELKPSYKIGDYVINKKTSWASTCCKDSYQFDILDWIGKIVDMIYCTTVKEMTYKIEVEPGKFCGKSHSQIELTTKPIKSITKPKREDFKKGVRVLCNNWNPKGLKGTVIGKSECGIHIVEFDTEFTGGHDGYFPIKGKNGHCYNFSYPEAYLTIIDEPKLNEEVKEINDSKFEIKPNSKIWIGDNPELFKKIIDKLKELGCNYKKDKPYTEGDTCIHIFNNLEIFPNKATNNIDSFEKNYPQYKTITLKDLGIETIMLDSSGSMNSQSIGRGKRLSSSDEVYHLDKIFKEEKISQEENYKPQIKQNKNEKTNKNRDTEQHIIGELHTVWKKPTKAYIGEGIGEVRIRVKKGKKTT